jgi:hypothetical protein
VNWNCEDAADPLVRQHAALIRSVEDMAQKAQEQIQATLIVALAGKDKKRG